LWLVGWLVIAIINNMNDQNSITKSLSPVIEARFHCKLCYLSYTQKVYLDRHIKKAHTKKKEVFCCKICNKVYQQRKGLSRHYKEKHDFSRIVEKTIATKYKCPQCNKVFI
jgi:uncharacterized C2H2 Zn-finger protein